MTALIGKLLVETRADRERELYRLTTDGHARLPQFLRLQTPMPVTGYRPIVRGNQIPAKAQKPATAIAVRPAAVVTVEATASERRKITADFEKAWLAFGRNFLVLGETVLRARKAACR